MYLKKIGCMIGLLALLCSGCAGRQQSQLSYIGAAKAKELALEACGMTASQAEFTMVDLSDQNGQSYYRVEFTARGEDYYYDIDALTGVIIDAKIPAGSVENELLAGDADQNAKDTGQNTGGTGQDAKGTSQNTEGTSQDTGGTGQNTKGTGQDAGGAAAEILNEEEARAKVLAHAGLSNEQVIFLKTQLDMEHGRKVFEVEFVADGGKEYDYEIDAYSGDVVSYDYDAEASLPPAAEGDGMISAQKAKELALAQVPGAKMSNIVEFETDRDDGRMQYEGKIIYEGMEYEFEIDAYSGAFRGWEAEPLD